MKTRYERRLRKNVAQKKQPAVVYGRQPGRYTKPVNRPTASREQAPQKQRAPQSKPVGRAVSRSATQEQVKARKKALATSRKKAAEARASHQWRRANTDENVLRRRSAHNLYGTARQVDESNFRGYADRLWAKAADLGHYPSGKAPKLDLYPRGGKTRTGKFDRDSPGLLGYVDPAEGGPGNRTVHIPSDKVYRARLRPDQKKVLGRMARSKNPRARADAKAAIKDAHTVRDVLPHEWTHAFQTWKALKNKRNTEGGAEALADLIVRELNKGKRKRKPANDDYKRYARHARKLGRQYITRGQFK